MSHLEFLNSFPVKQNRVDVYLFIYFITMINRVGKEKSRGTRPGKFPFWLETRVKLGDFPDIIRVWSRDREGIPTLIYPRPPLCIYILLYLTLAHNLACSSSLSGSHSLAHSISENGSSREPVSTTGNFRPCPLLQMARPV